ncbi:MAG: FxsA family protein [Candidatus Dadabacteria bacterium]|nr:FxsA family protein [Candidatus Dadabacteria bacterium]
MFFRILPFFVAVPIIELAILIKLGKVIGVLETVYVVIATAVLGAYLAQAQGASALAAMRRDMSEARMPSEPIMDGILILAGAVALLTPGLVTDLAGFTVLIPLTRRMIKRLIRARIERRLGIVDISPPAG